jgi:hypothetical protein
MDVINEKNMIVKRLRNEFKDIKFEVDIASHRGPMSSYLRLRSLFQRK